MTADPRPLFAAFNRGVQRARVAYRTDQRRREGLCPRCGEAGGSGDRSRWCSPCRRAAKA